jgi:uncharacterized integral membrane protein
LYNFILFFCKSVACCLWVFNIFLKKFRYRLQRVVIEPMKAIFLKRRNKNDIVLVNFFGG